MQNYIKYTIVLVASLFFSCEDVIDVEVQNDSERLVIEASLDWEKGTNGNNQSIELRKSTPFFDTTSNTPVTGASVKVTNDSNGDEFIFIDQNNGTYTTDAFVPIIDATYSLEIIYGAEVYTAKETLIEVPDITDLFQGTEDGFDDEILEAHVVFTDPPEEGNNYLFRYDFEDELLPELEVGDDEFINGNEIDWWIEIEEDEETDEIEAFQPGETVAIEMYAISTAYKNYIEILIEQMEGVDLFSSTPVLVKGNCVNETNPDNYAHGYFRVTQVNKTSYTFE